MKKIVPWVLAIIPALVFLQSLPFKFTGAAETQHIFGTIGSWFDSIGLSAIGGPFASFGAYAVGAIELVAAILLLIPKTRFVGALIGFVILSGALFFHLGTPLGVAVQMPGAESGDPTLFIMAVVAWLCLIATMFIARRPADA